MDICRSITPELLRNTLDFLPSDDTVIEYAEEVVNGFLRTWPELPAMPYRMESLNWDVCFSDAPNSFQVGLQGLLPVGYLCRAYEIREDERYLEVAWRLALSWIDYTFEKAEDSMRVWNAQSASFRTLVFCYLLSVCICNQDFYLKKIKKTIDEHVAWLENEKEYQANSNHGIYQCCALLYVSVFFHDEHMHRRYQLAKDRLQNQYDKAFNSEGAHIENSPSYVCAVVRLFHVCTALLCHLHDSDASIFTQRLQMCGDFMRSFVMPNGEVALVGDSDDKWSNSANWETIFENAKLVYAVNRGKKGEKPKRLYAYYPQTGYYVGRETWEDGKLQDSMWVLFKAGYETQVHKHADDLSILLYAKGCPVFVDSGRYNYMYGDPISEYMKGALAHNTIVVDRKSYSVTNARASTCGMLEAQFGEDEHYIRAFNDGYDGVRIDRALYRVGNRLLIHDEIQSEEDHRYSQLFHLSEHMRIISEEDHCLKASIGNSGYMVCIRQLNQGTDLESYRGDRIGDDMGLQSRALNQFFPIDTLMFNRQARSTDFVTLISVVPLGDESVEACYEAETMTVNFQSGVKITLTRRERPPVPLRPQRGEPWLEWLSDKEICFHVPYHFKDDCGIHWHLYRNGTHYDYRYGKNEDCFYYTFTDAGRYTLIYSIETPSGDRQTWSFPAVQYPQPRVKDILEYTPSLQNELKGLGRERAIEVGQIILGGGLNVWDSIPAMPYNMRTLDWGCAFTKSPNAFQLQLHSFRFLTYLADAYRYTARRDFLFQGLRLIRSWLSYEKQEGSKENAFVWNDHAMAERVKHMVFFFTWCERAELMDDRLRAWVTEIMRLHAQHLCDEATYAKNNNHGIYQDVALLLIAAYQSDDRSPELIKVAKERLDAQYAFAFNDEMVHVENSPEYQLAVMNLFQIAKEVLELLGDAHGQVYREKLNESLRFLMWTLKPNGQFAEIGDTDGKAVDENVPNKRLAQLGNPNLQYAATLGQEGEQPEENHALFPRTGYYFYRSSWNQPDLTKATWLMFKSGYSSRVHKHADDLSIMLCARGHEVLIDRGKYNYLMGNRTTDVLHGVWGHNGIMVDGHSYPIAPERGKRTGFCESGMRGDFHYIRAFNDSYDGVYVDRAIYHYGDIILIHDDIIADESHTYTQMFHLSEHVRVISGHEEGDIVGEIAQTGCQLRICQLLSPTSRLVQTGEDEENLWGYRSKTFNSTTPITSVCFEKIGKKVSFVTVLVVEDSQKIPDKIQFDREKEIIRIGQMSPIQLVHRDRPNLNAFKASLCFKTLTIKPQFNVPEGTVFNWQIIDIKWNKVHHEVLGSCVPEFCFNIPFYVDFYVKMHMQMPNGNELQGIVAKICFDRETKRFVDKSNDLPLVQTPQRRYQMVERIAPRKLHFHIEVAYDQKFIVQWIMHRNGSVVKWEQTINQMDYEYLCDQPGFYTMAYYIKTPHGDSQLWNFAGIDIA